MNELGVYLIVLIISLFLFGWIWIQDDASKKEINSIMQKLDTVYDQTFGSHYLFLEPLELFISWERQVNKSIIWIEKNSKNIIFPDNTVLTDYRVELSKINQQVFNIIKIGYKNNLNENEQIYNQLTQELKNSYDRLNKLNKEALNKLLQAEIRRSSRYTRPNVQKINAMLLIKDLQEKVKSMIIKTQQDLVKARSEKKPYIET